MAVCRHYICDNCDHEFQMQQSIHDAVKRKCPKCKKMTLYQDLTGQIHLIRQEPTTIGQLAERNSQAMGKAGVEQADAHRKEQLKNARKETLRKKGHGDIADVNGTSWYNPDGENLAKKLKKLDTPQKATKYIMEGE